MPPGINYVAGSASGTGVTFGSTIIAGNVVTFNIASIPSSGFVDVSFAVAVNCSVSTNSANIKNTYKVNWSTFFTNPYVTPTYPLSFPSLSVTVDSPQVTRSCVVPFVRKVTICNGGFGSVDSVTLSDVEQTSLVVTGFSAGTVSGAGTSNAKTVLKAADFLAVGNGDGKLDQGECIIVYDTQSIVGAISPINGTIRADWGCSGNTCTNGTGGNVFAVTTNINNASPSPVVTRTLSTLNNGTDSCGDIYGRSITYREVVKNTGTVIARNVYIWPGVIGLKYIVPDSIWASKNGNPRYHPSYSVNGNNFYENPAGQMGTVIAPPAFAGYDQPTNAIITLGDLLPGDSVVVTFEVRTAGPITRTIDFAYGNCGVYNICGSCYIYEDGPSLSAAIDARLGWSGCPTGNYSVCPAAFSQNIYTGASATPTAELPAGTNVHYLARFRNFSLVDSSAILNTAPRDCNNIPVYGDMDTVKAVMSASVMDLPFYTAKSKFTIKIYTQGGIKWDGNLAKTYGRLTTWGNANWQADQVIDNTAADSTITVYFKRTNCPVLSNFASNAYNSYSGAFSLNMQFVNTCPGDVTKQFYMTRIYTIDTTTDEGPIEAGPNVPRFSWQSKCAPVFTDGVIIKDYNHARITFGQPDNNNDGIADATGSLNMSVIATDRFTWGDTFQLKHKLIVRTTQAGGVPYLYLNTTVNGQAAATNTECNNMLKKTIPQVKLTRPGVGIFTASGGSVPGNSAASFLANLSLQGAGGITIPGITAYQDGDTVEVTENLVYWTPHETFNGGNAPVSWSFTHTPYTSIAPNPTPAQQFRRDSIYNCPRFYTYDFSLYQASSMQGTPAICMDTTVLRVSFGPTVLTNCGTAAFPGEARNIVTPIKMKLVIDGGWSLQPGNNIRVNWQKKINGTSACTNVINNQVLPTSQYTTSGDTLIFNLAQIGTFFGQDITVDQMRSIFTFDLRLKYTPTTAQQGCAQDHLVLSKTFTTLVEYTPIPPMDPTPLVRNFGAGVALSWPGGNTNSVSLPTLNTVTVTQPNVMIPLRYNNANSYANDFLAIPDVPGITVDSVKDVVTGGVIVPSGNIYNLSYLPTGNRDFQVYTRVTLCNNAMLTFYADRTPCSGIPASWAAYSCKANATQVAFNYQTFAGELQMKDSLYSTQKDLCTTDTVQFAVFNSQTQDAHGVKISFTLPAAMGLVPGQTQLKMANGSFVTVTDPVLTAGTYTWTLPAADTLRNINTAPANSMILRCSITTSCGYISGSQIVSSIAGNVACGPITSLFNTNPAPLNINGAPALSYFTNVDASVQQATGCGPTASYDYRIAMHISGGPTQASDSVKVVLPAAYSYVSYSPAAPGSVHAPAGTPSVSTLANGSTQLTWKTTAGIAGGDSIIFTFKYKEVSTAENKCAASPLRQSIVSTSINSSAFCATTGTNCGVGIGNGGDTVNMQSLKPSISTTTSTVVFGNAFGSSSPTANSYLYIAGNLTNTGSAAVAPGTAIIMEPFMDLDNSGTVTPGDYAFDPYVYSGGLAMGTSIPYNYTDSLVNTACPSCGNKNVLLRFSNNPSLPLASSQCLCDSVIVMPAVTNTIPLQLTLGDFSGAAEDCSHTRLSWRTYEEKGDDLRFEVQASVNGKDYETMATVAAKGVAGSSYTHIVSMPAATTYFRLIMWADGKGTYSPALTVNTDCWTKEVVAVYPNPFTNTVYIRGAKKGSEIVLRDITGRKLLTRKAKGNGQDQLDMDRYASGAYIITVMDESGVTTTIKLSKN
jgi:hypothetical protein